MKLRHFLEHTMNCNVVIVKEDRKKVLIGRPGDLLRDRYDSRLNQTFGLVLGTERYTEPGLISNAIVVSIIPSAKKDDKRLVLNDIERKAFEEPDEDSI